MHSEAGIVISNLKTDGRNGTVKQFENDDDDINIHEIFSDVYEIVFICYYAPNVAFDARIARP